MSYTDYFDNAQIADMVGKTFNLVKSTHDDMLIFENTDERYVFFHRQGCCESVTLEDIVGELSDLEGMPLLQAEEVSNVPNPGPFGSDESYTWTFYKFATNKGSVTVRWYGTSNGYYSEEVHLGHERLK